ncbi:MAG: PEGA domain-containing protein [Minicystis sp.]
MIEHGKTLEITPALERVHYGYLRVDGNAEEVTVKVDGARRGLYVPIGEPLRIRLPSGPHKLELEASGRKTYAGEIEVPRGQELGVHGRLSYKPARSTTVVSGALTVGAIVGGIALFKQAASPQEPSMGSPPGNAPTGASTWLRVGGAASFGVGALLGASTVYSIVTDPTPPSTVRLDKPKDLDESELDVPGGFVPGARGRVLGDDARANNTRQCGAL